MNYPELFFTGFLLSLSLCLDIGVVNLALINTAIRAGMRAGMQLGLGSCVGDLVYAVLSLVGIGLILRFDTVRWTVSLLGIAVLLFLAWDSARTAARPAAAEVDAPMEISAQRLFARGLLLSLASPTSILWFAAVGRADRAQQSAFARRPARVARRIFRRWLHMVSVHHGIVGARRKAARRSLPALLQRAVGVALSLFRGAHRHRFVGIKKPRHGGVRNARKAGISRRGEISTCSSRAARTCAARRGRRCRRRRSTPNTHTRCC